ncbi:phosphatidylinositol 3-kinase regulatory subunit alpha-like [Mastacembelus armatus]|uniref:phosphatidylinositol 3-kinase regulatory subunit alpha-like n=1 Tax=Mastacembelus armatus TaxID=205130 RepID=UPI000E454222|nr:phosphatidylinositol 3-kinase regulatory subunit alpha-like [Mastacembelus armatus]
MASDSIQYRALFEYKRERGDDISLQPGDLLTVPKASVVAKVGLEYQEGDERSPKGWLHGINERTKEKGDFPGTFVEYVGLVRASPSAPKSWPRPVPPIPGGPHVAAGPPGAAAASGVEVEFLSDVAPVVVWRLIEAIDKHGLNSEALYRAPAASAGPADLRQALDSDPVSVDLDQYDVVSLTDALRGFLQDLPIPIIPSTIYSELVYTAQESPSVEECGERLKRILESPSIPQANHQLLVHLSRHLARVSQNNQTGPRLLAQAFSEVVFKHSPLRFELCALRAVIHSAPSGDVLAGSSCALRVRLNLRAAPLARCSVCSFCAPIGRWGPQHQPSSCGLIRFERTSELGAIGV